MATKGWIACYVWICHRVSCLCQQSSIQLLTVIRTVVTSILRLWIIIKELSNDDVSWGSAPTAFWLQVIPYVKLLVHLANAVLRVIEAHMMIICATLPSLRKFFKHIAPKWIGERTSSGSDALQNHPDLITFGRSNQRKKYNKFDSTTGYGLDTVNDVPYGMKTFHDVDVKGGPRGIREHDEGSAGDEESQKGILETRTATVTRG